MGHTKLRQAAGDMTPVQPVAVELSPAAICRTSHHEVIEGLDILAGKDAMPGKYNIMIRSHVDEKICDHLGEFHAMLLRLYRNGCEFDPRDQASQRFCHVGYGANKVGTVSQHTQAKMIVIIGLPVGRVVESAEWRISSCLCGKALAGRNIESTRLNSRFSSIKLLGNHRSV